MSVFKKLKDVLFDIEEEEIPVISKEEEKEENPIKEVKVPKHEIEDEIEPIEEEPIIPKKEHTFNFPMDDFEDDIPVRSKRRDYFDEEFTSRSSYKEKKTFNEGQDEFDYLRVKETKKETYKPFKPSPVISPVYGILDQNYTKDDVIVKSDSNKKSPNLDDVRKKAYGSKKKEEEIIEDEFEEPLKTLDEILIDKEEPKKEVIETIEEDEFVLDKNEPIGVYDDELPDEPYADEEETEVVEEPIEEEPAKEDSIESDLFNLIDSMYEERNEREEEE